MEPASQVTLASFFTNLLALFGVGAVSAAALREAAAAAWLWVTVAGYAATVVGLVVIVYGLTRLFDLRRREEEYYTTPIKPPEGAASASAARFAHIEQLARGGGASEWREAIIEADIMLDELLARAGYTGEGVGEKLLQADRSRLASLNDAWEAHKVRNQIAHEGSRFDLSDTLAQRTIARYAAVFRELRAI